MLDRRALLFGYERLFRLPKLAVYIWWFNLRVVVHDAFSGNNTDTL